MHGHLCNKSCIKHTVSDYVHLMYLSILLTFLFEIQWFRNLTMESEIKL